MTDQTSGYRHHNIRFIVVIRNAEIRPVERSKKFVAGFSTSLSSELNEFIKSGRQTTESTVPKKAPCRIK